MKIDQTIANYYNTELQRRVDKESDKDIKDKQAVVMQYGLCNATCIGIAHKPLAITIAVANTINNYTSEQLQK